ncbi:MAG: hypothetical protein KDD56_00855 [Bdellovibrionales bacterium]|nr:hypothetical protein [Bdellovibrionales bacterium]
MAVCLDYRSVQTTKSRVVVSVRLQLMIIFFLLVILAAKVWIQLKCTNLGYQLAEQREETYSLDMEKRELELQLSVLLRTDNLEKQAISRLGLQALKPEQARRLKY